jgi:hypothetical protein
VVAFFRGEKVNETPSTANRVKNKNETLPTMFNAAAL